MYVKMTKENIRKRFEFDLNIGRFKSDYSDGETSVSFSINSIDEFYSIINILKCLGFRYCYILSKFEERPMPSFIETDVITINIKRKSFVEYSWKEYDSLSYAYKLENVNECPKYLYKYDYIL